MKRLFDFSFALLLMILLSVPFLFISLIVKLTSKGTVFYTSDRIGKNNSVFKMYKFRTMRVGTPQVATHLMKNPGEYSTPIGPVLRRLSLDELPQLYNILKGDMSFVGPRPALFNQIDLITLRTDKGIDKLLPGLTGWAQINGRDELAIPAKVAYEEYYLRHHSFHLDLKILYKTSLKVLRGEGIQH
ncbi:MAG: sugar transferase [Nitrospirae bacterium]|nr:sugar transferase [Nitrospirota bacterium]